jgi:hypothetical protein
VINRKDPLRAVLTNAKKAVASLPPERQLDPDEREVLDAEHGRGRTPVSSVSREWERMKVQRRNGVEEQLGKLDADRLDKSRSLIRMSQANPGAVRDDLYDVRIGVSKFVRTIRNAEIRNRRRE